MTIRRKGAPGWGRRFGAAILLLGVPAAAAAGECGDVASLRAAFERHVKAFNMPRDIETVLDFEEDLVEFGHGGAGAKDFAKMSREDHRALLVAGTRKKEIYDWTPRDHAVRIVGGAGLVWGLYDRRERMKGGETTIDRGRFTATYVCAEGAWRAVLWHRSPLRGGPEVTAP